MTRRTVAVAFLILLLPFGISQTDMAGVDTFESYSPGTVHPEPSSGWYEWTTIVSGLTATVSTSDCPATGSGQCLRFVSPADSTSRTSAVSFSPVVETDTIQFDLKYSTTSFGFQWFSIYSDVGDKIEFMVGGSDVTPAHQFCGSNAGADSANWCTTSNSGTFRIEFDWSAKTYDLYFNDGLVKSSAPFRNSGGGTATGISSFDFRHQIFGGWRYSFDNLVMVGPAGPSGVSGVVTDATVSPEVHYVRWLPSPDDPDLQNAAYTYLLYYDDGSETLAATVPPGNAVGGVMAVSVNAAISGDADWYVEATAAGFTSSPSCSITLDSDVQGDSDSCGTSIPGEENAGSDFTGDDGALFGGDRAGLAESLQVSVGSLDFLIGIMLTMLILAGGFFAYGGIGAAGGGLVGVVVSYAFGLFPFWSLYVLGFLLAAGAILYVKSGGAARG